MLKLAAPQGPFLLRTGGVSNISVPSLAEASRVSRRMIDDSFLGSSNWGGAWVYSEHTGALVAVLSYNGRAWSPSDKTNPEGDVLPGEFEFERT